MQPAAAPSALPAPQDLTRIQRLFRPTAPAVTVAASALQTPVTPHKNNNLLAGVRSGEAVAGAAQQGILGLEVLPGSRASSRRGERTTTPEHSYGPPPRGCRKLGGATADLHNIRAPTPAAGCHGDGLPHWKTEGFRPPSLSSKIAVYATRIVLASSLLLLSVGSVRRLGPTPSPDFSLSGKSCFCRRD